MTEIDPKLKVDTEYEEYGFINHETDFSDILSQGPLEYKKTLESQLREVESEIHRLTGTPLFDIYSCIHWIYSNHVGGEEVEAGDLENFTNIKNKLKLLNKDLLLRRWIKLRCLHYNMSQFFTKINVDSTRGWIESKI